MNWFAQAPSNIALIKYMGKKDQSANIPDNGSLSYTLNNLMTSVELEKTSLPQDQWEPLQTPGARKISLSAQSQQRFLAHLNRLKQVFGYSGNFIVRSCNNFPLGSGLASSASSFAALTRCVVLALCDLTGQPLLKPEEQAGLSRQGSGSSCRSFFTPWALWTEEDVGAISLPYPELIHQVVLIDAGEKEVSSGLAHQRVKTSPDYPERSFRAEQRLQALIASLNQEQWALAYTICWDEFQDMHHLFVSADQPFTYMTEKTQTLLQQLQSFWDKKGDGPLVTMDAGPNVHLLYRLDQAELAAEFQRDYLSGYYDVL